MSLTVTIAGNPVTILYGSFKFTGQIDQQDRCTFTVIDAAGTANFTKGQPVSVTDAGAGISFTGYVNKPKAVKLPPNVHRQWAVDCFDQTYLPNKRTSNKVYTNQYSGTIVADMIQRNLAAEHVTMAAALRWDELLTDFQAGTLTNVVATSNSHDINPGDGDLELASAGTAASFSEVTQADFNLGSLVGLTAPVSGGLTFTPTQAIKLAANMTVPGAGNAYIYVKIWGGSYVIPNSFPTLFYDVWIPDSCPANQQMAGVDFVCTDGTTFRDFPGNQPDAQGIGGHPGNDLTGLATNQWYSRVLPLYGTGTMAGKTISYVMIAFEGDKTGTYTAYFRNVSISNFDRSSAVTIFGPTDTHTQATPQTISDNGYSSLSCTVLASYERYGYFLSPSFNPAAAGICKSSYIDWLVTLPNSSFTLAVQASIDGTSFGITYLPCTLNGVIPGLLAGMNLAGVLVFFQYQLTNNGNDPTLTPLLSWVKANVLPSYAATKSDIINTTSSQAQWQAGTITNLNFSTVNVNWIELNGWARNFDDASYANQTLYGSNGPFQGILNKTLYLQSNAGGDVRSRLDFAGNAWQNFTAEVDVFATANGNMGLEYRTTSWVNGINSYAYLAEISLTQIKLGYGSNGGGNSYTNLATVAITLSSGNWHRIKVIANGSNHQVFLDNVLYINVNDATYAAAGYLGLRFWNTSGVQNKSQFDNFGVVAALSGTWVSPAIDIHALGTISNSEITTQADAANTPTITSVLTEISLNNGSTWAACTNGAQVPGLTPGTNVSGMTQVLIRLTIAATTAATGSQMPDVQGVTLTVLGAYNSTGNRISPALSLAAVGRAGSSLVNWNAILPNGNTTLLVDTSIDGGATWQNIATAGGPVGNISTQPLPTVDTFGVDDHTSYTSTFGSGGSLGTWTFDTANSRLVATNGSKAMLLWTGLMPTDVDVFCDMDYADVGGLVWREVDTSNYYSLNVRDGSASNGTPNTITLNKTVAGTTSTLGSVSSVSFPRNTYRRIRVTMIGTVITVYFDGTQIQTYTDGSSLGGGGIGLFQTLSGTARFYQFRVQPQGQNVSSLSVLTRQRLASTDPTQTPAVLDVQTLVASPSIGPGVLIPSATYQNTFVTTNIQDQNKQSNYWWTIKADKSAIFQARNATPAPWVIATANQDVSIAGQTFGDVLVQGLTLENSGDLYRNRQTLTGVKASQVFTKIFHGDGTSTSWTLDFPVIAASGIIPVAMTLNGQSVTVGIKGVDSGKQYYYQPGSTGINQDASGTVLLNADTLVVTYTGSFTTAITIDNTGSLFPGTVNQAAMAAIDGSSGIVEDVTDVTALNLNVAAATTYANQLLQRFGVIGRTLTFKTFRSGLAVGQQLAAFVPEQNCMNVQFLVTQIDITITVTTGGALVYWYSVTAMEGPNLGTWVRLFSSILAKR